MNVPAATRRDQLTVNIERLKTLTTNLGPRYVVCNIPAARIEAIENDFAVARYTAVVGKPDRPSPDINIKDRRDQFQSILDRAGLDRAQGFDSTDAGAAGLSRQEPHPYFRSGHKELQPSQIDWYSDDAVNYMFRQDPGSFNSLGSLRINFPSAYGVYMHDTPLKNLFGDDFRYHSSGCCACRTCASSFIGARRNQRLAARPDRTAVESGEQNNARLTKPVPLHWVYVTAWSASDGIVQFREDIYSRDGVGAPAIPATVKL